MKKYAQRINKFLRVILTIAILQVAFLYNPPSTEAAALANPFDFITSDNLNETGVGHSVTFGIPDSGHDIIATDYIRIILTNYSAVTAPTSISGHESGAPSYGLTGGNIAYVTGITKTAGGILGQNASLGISGITATNPADAADFDVTIQVTNDISGSIVYDTVTFDAAALKNTVTTSVSVVGPSAALQVLGYTSPNAFVTILLNAVVAGTTTADGSGNFNKTITGLTPVTTYSVGIFSQDTNLNTSQTVSFILNTLPATTHIFGDIVIPTTIVLDPPEIDQGDILTISGLAHPLSQITVFVGNGAPYSPVVQANSSGSWILNFNSGVNTLPAGTHITYGREVVTGGYTSILTQSIQFVINPCIAADVNCDGFVNLIDFSIMLFYWQQTNPSNPRADINKDGVVNLTDFSVMLFFWTG